jgi:hypothetical protein
MKNFKNFAIFDERLKSLIEKLATLFMGNQIKPKQIRFFLHSH